MLPGFYDKAYDFLKGQKSTELAQLFYKELLKIHQLDLLPLPTKIKKLFELLQLSFFEVTKKEKIQFTTLFSRIAFVTHKFDFDKKLQYLIHLFRKQYREADDLNTYQLGQYVLANTIHNLFGQEILDELKTILEKDFSFNFPQDEIAGFRKKIKVVALADDFDNFQLLVKDAHKPTDTKRVQYNIAHRNENFNKTIEEIREVFGFPLNLNLLDVEIDKDGVYRPQAIVVEPDYLVDVSAISECFKEFGTIPVFYLLKKYLPFEASKYLMIGNIANYFLDELMTNPQVTFKETFPKVFRLNPLTFALFNNQTLSEIMKNSQKHFVNLKRLILQELEKFEIEKEGCYLEPSFFSETYGIQGRLDVFYPKGKKSAIIELKSGKAYMPNRYGISQNHYTQTLLYDLIVKSVFGNEMEPTNYILYSGLDMRNMRFAPVIKAQQYEAIRLRNSLVAIEYKLLSNPELLLSRIQSSRYPHLKGFLKSDIGSFEKVYSELSPTEQDYFKAFSSFIAREHLLAKTGIQGSDRVNGLANLWLNHHSEKEENFEILANLKIELNRAAKEDPIIIFNKTESTNPLANFRKGDIAVLYPKIGSNNTVLNSQIFKGIIQEISHNQVILRLRYKQFHSNIFDEYSIWNIEHDMMDMGFIGMYRGLFEFAKAPKNKRDLLLTNIPPGEPYSIEIEPVEELTKEQNLVLKKALSAKDYFLLWGPPGTGKTSKMLKHLVKFLMSETQENLLVLAYTNRAVDELCEAILAGFGEHFLRIGSPYSTASAFHQNLLSTQLKTINTRTALRAILEKHRIFVSTVASFSNRRELIKLKKFDTVIIDEASQILEPHLVGLLPHFKRFILIGDHLQLPAVVVQKEEESRVENEDLNELGLLNRRNSLFERLFKRSVAEDWTWAFDKLSHQGRMHREIMAFPNKHFYGGFLNILPKHIEHSKNQKSSLRKIKQEYDDVYQMLLSNQRLIFIPTKVDPNSITGKTNRNEAELVAKLVESSIKLLKLNDSSFSKNSIGIITPYRAQIAQIREVLISKNIDLEKLTIDTVERYQGGARDIIILSLCTNSTRQLESLISTSTEGVDRKLNVALTRAKEQVIILGNEDILNNNPVYKALIQFCHNEKIQ